MDFSKQTPSNPLLLLLVALLLVLRLSYKSQHELVGDKAVSKDRTVRVSNDWAYHLPDYCKAHLSS